MTACNKVTETHVIDHNTSFTQENDTNSVNAEHVRITWQGDYSGTANGYYRFIPWPKELYKEDSPWLFRANIAYLDINSHRYTYLCNVPGCLHNNMECTSFIKASGDLSIFTSYDESCLFMISRGAENGEVYSSDDLGMIIKSALDGSSREILYTLSSNECFVTDSLIAVSENYIYTTLRKISDSQTGTETYLYRFSTSGDGYEQLLKIGNGDCLIGAYDEIIIISQNDIDQNSLKPGSIIKTMSRQYSYNINSGDVVLLSDFDKSYNAEHNGMLYRFEVLETIEGPQVTANSHIEIPISFEIYRLSVNNTLEESCGTIKLPSDPAGTTTFGLYSHYVIATYIDKQTDNERRIALDIVSGEVKELYLSLENDATTKIRIIYENDEYLIVIVGQIDSTITFTDENGVPTTFDYPDKAVFALIKPEDFFSDIPSYIFVEDLTI